MTRSVLVLGGYGFFGTRIATELARNQSIRVLIGGRDRGKALRLARSLALPDENAIAIDARDAALSQQLVALRVSTLIHTAGPFQGQGYDVARAAIAAHCHYIDLADGRNFVAGITELEGEARRNGVAVISGASSVPALSSAVVDQYAPQFSRLNAIRMGIGTGARAPGIATVRGIFGYCGRPIRRWENGAWTTTYGWMDLQRRGFPAPVGTRLLGSCDVPDLELFPKRYAGVQTVAFHAGFASDAGHLVVWALSCGTRAGILPGVQPFAGALNRVSQWIEPLISDKGAMFVELEGLDRSGAPLRKTWNLVVGSNHGPYVPCGASIALARKLAAGAPLPSGAYPCMGLLTPDEYLAPLQQLDIRVIPA